jgi:hypothetical protein
MIVPLAGYGSSILLSRAWATSLAWLYAGIHMVTSGNRALPVIDSHIMKDARNSVV